MPWGGNCFGESVTRVYYNTTRLNFLAQKLKELGIALDELSEEEKKIVIEKANTSPETLRKLYKFLSDCIEK